MEKKDLRIVYMGTPDFAVESLRILVENGYNVCGVVTMPDKPAGRGHKLQYSSVKKYALEKELPLLQPEKLKDEAFLHALRAWKADLQIVVAFRMLPEVVWNMPHLGTFNLHASLLPQYRGAAPINWAVINGERETGVTTFFLTHKIDTGKIINQQKISIGDDDDAGSVHDKLMKIGASLVKQTVDDLLAGKVAAVPQEEFFRVEEELKEAPKIFKETCQIDWTKPGSQVRNLIRGLSPHPTAWTELELQPGNGLCYLKVYASEFVEMQHSMPPATVDTDFKTYLRVATPDGFVSLKTVQAAGKKTMSVGDFLRGMKM